MLKIIHTLTRGLKRVILRREPRKNELKNAVPQRQWYMQFVSKLGLKYGNGVER